jgi:hypothetical protein
MRLGNDESADTSYSAAQRSTAQYFAVPLLALLLVVCSFFPLLQCLLDYRRWGLQFIRNPWNAQGEGRPRRGPLAVL